jgi:hypothetical protein
VARRPFPLAKAARRIGGRAQAYLFGAAAAGGVFTVFALVGVGGQTGPPTAWFGGGESILEAGDAASARVAASSDDGFAGTTSKSISASLPNGSRLDKTQSLSPPGVPAAGPGPQPAGPGAQGDVPPLDPDAPRTDLSPLPSSEAPNPVVPGTPSLPLPPAPTLPSLPEVPKVVVPEVALPQVPVPQVPVPQVPVPQIPVPQVPTVTLP